MSCHKVIQIVAGCTLTVNLFVTAVPHCNIIVETHPLYTTVGHLNVGSVGSLIPMMSLKMPGNGLT